MSTPLLDPLTDPSVVKTMSAALSDLAGRVRKLENGSRASQLGKSSINGAYIPILDEFNNLRMVVGRQTDGGYAVKYVAGGSVAIPSTPIGRAAQLAIVVGWDGGFANGTDRNEEFERVDIYMSDTPGLDPFAEGSELLIQGSLYRPGALPIPADLGTKYVVFVGVNKAQQKSLKSQEVSFEPLPADEIGAGVITAINLAATIALVTQLVCGDVSGKHITIGESGIFGYGDDASTIWLALNASDASGLLTGEFKTALTGARVVLNPGGDDPDTIRFYPSDGSSLYASITGVTFGGQAGVLLTGNNSDATGNAGYVAVFPWATMIGYGSAESDNLDNLDGISEMAVGNDSAFMGGPTVDIHCRHRTVGFGNRISLAHFDAGGVLYPNGALDFVLIGADNTTRMVNPGKNIGWLCATNEFMIRNGGNGETYMPIRASAFNVSSSIEEKVNLEAPSLYALDAILKAKMYRYERSDEIRDPNIPKKFHYGTMAELLPDEVIHRGDDEHGEGLSVDAFQLSMLALAGIQDQHTILAAVGQILDARSLRLVELESETQSLDQRIVKLEAENTALKTEVAGLSTQLNKLTSHPVITKLLGGK